MADALIWGASGGMGRALSSSLIAKGWRVFGAARHSEHIVGEATLALEFDARDENSIQQVVMRVAQESDNLKLVAYMAGELAYDRLDIIGLEGWERTFSSNVTGAFLTTTHSLNLVQEGSHFIYIGAYLDHLRVTKMGAYVAAKAALQELVTVLAKENRRHKFTLVRPGATDTPFWKQVSLRLPSNAKTPEQVAEAILARVEEGGSGDLDL
ncbi:MAG: SDR family NAD(P)-dependent oxidoreductase [Anaerolineae bacterium]|nr:SDR family NAD(P)-dependent oxidoreductase [Anaerolineae bacterium]MDW8170942.1 SDR family NAD(P)-dependent oxidoreductase [Anaerolineae bacterium]